MEALSSPESPGRAHHPAGRHQFHTHNERSPVNPNLNEPEPAPTDAVILSVLREEVRQWRATAEALREQLATAQYPTSPMMPQQRIDVPEMTVKGRGLKAPYARWTAYPNEVVVRIDDSANHETWVEVRIPASGLALWLSGCLAQRKGFYADMIRLLDEVGAEEEQ